MRRTSYSQVRQSPDLAGLDGLRQETVAEFATTLLLDLQDLRVERSLCPHALNCELFRSEVGANNRLVTDSTPQINSSIIKS